MSSTSNLGGKSLSAATSYSPSAPPSSSPATFDSGSSSGARRSGPSSVPSGVQAAAPRKGQAARKQHRNQRRPLRTLDRPDIDQDDNMAELRALRNPSSRRGQTSITHLLNYSVHSRHFPEPSRHHYSRRNPTSNGYHPADKARFVHANYRFVVSPEHSYLAQAAAADAHLDWQQILQILASKESQSASCPICLSEPVAPRMARCGHIYCLPCLLRFFDSSPDDEPLPRKDARWKSCPICEDSFKLAETKPLRFYAGQENPLPRPGQDVVLRLMVRDSGSTLALPKEGGVDVLNLGEDVPWHFAANVMDYAHIMKGTADYMSSQFDAEIEHLRTQAAEDEYQFGMPDGDCTQKAIRAVNLARDRIMGQLADVGPLSNPAISASTAKAKHPAGQQFHFYTAPPHLYLSPLDIRILKTKFGDFANFPTTLLPQLEHISAGHVVDDALRKRAKYLSHLPQGCVVSFLECDWTDIVSADILETFSADLDKRRKSHKDKAAQEERERLQAERMEAAAIGRGTRHHFEQTHQDVADPVVPVVNSEDFQPLVSESGTSPPNPRPGFDRLADLSTSPSTSKTVWGTRALPTEVDDGVRRPPENDGWLKEDEYLGAQQIAFQMEAFGLEDSSTSSAPAPAPSGGKKKKKQKITLMSTGGHRGG